MFGYVGTGFHGLQMSATSSAAAMSAAATEGIKTSDGTALATSAAAGSGGALNTGPSGALGETLPTVEAELERALNAVGCIADHNLGNLERVSAGCKHAAA